MQVVILAGGFGTRLSEETQVTPKPMVKIGVDPILTHIINYYYSFGHKEFIIAAGYKQELIHDYFHRNRSKFQKMDVLVVDTGLNTNTGGRIRRLEPLLHQKFFLTYGDGLSDVDLEELVRVHIYNEKSATVTAVKPPARFGALTIEGDLVTKFGEKDPSAVSWINGGFFCLEKNVCTYITSDEESFEGNTMSKLVESEELAAYKHSGWWQPMDTLREKKLLQELWDSGTAPWVPIK